MSETAPAAPVDTAPLDDDGWEWAIVEIFGHRKLAGRTREEERFGAKMLRVDVPNKGDPAALGWTTSFFGGSALFSFTPTDETTALRLNKFYLSPSRYALAAPEEDDVVDVDAEEVHP